MAATDGEETPGKIESNGITRRRATRKNEAWRWDFIFDRTEQRQGLKWFVVIDEFTRECVVVEVERRMTSRDCMDLLSVVERTRDLPMVIRSDTGPEFVAGVMHSWQEGSNVRRCHIEPGILWENGPAWGFNAQLRDIGWTNFFTSRYLSLPIEGQAVERRVKAGNGKAGELDVPNDRQTARAIQQAN